MDIITTPPYGKMQRIYNAYFSLGNLQADLSTKFALISLTGYVVYKLKQKKPDVTSYSVLRKIIGNYLPEDYIKGIAVVVDDFCFNCKDFPTFGIEDKKIPAKIKEILLNYLPF